MVARELLSRLTYLTLAGYADGEYIWVGDDEAWNRVMWADDGVKEYDPYQ